MAWSAGALTRAVLAPRIHAVTSRSLTGEDGLRRRHLDRIPQAVVVGFEAGLESRGDEELCDRLSLMDLDLRGFAYEGATMALCLTGLPRSQRPLQEMLHTHGRPHLFLAYIGIGFAMARLPRSVWSRVLPELEVGHYHPTMSWLAVDGYGFDLAYFDAGRWVDRQERVAPWPWLGFPTYFARAADQGIGRALWFLNGGNSEATAEAVANFPSSRRPDLWSGVGLAATFAGPAGLEEILRLRDLAGSAGPDLGVGAVLAASARVAADHLPVYTAEATAALTGGFTAEQAARLADDCAITRNDVLPGYERWRQAIREKVTIESGLGLTRLNDW